MKILDIIENKDGDDNGTCDVNILLNWAVNEAPKRFIDKEEVSACK